jgi:hypothetical protein
MKQLLIAIAMVLAFSMNVDAAAQKHRHTPRTEQVDSTKAKDAIEAFSDTTAVGADNANNANNAEDDEYASYSRRDVQEAKEVIESLGGLVNSGMIIGVVAIFVIFLLAPIIIICLVFYFVNRNRKDRIKLAQMAIQNGQPIPDNILKEQQQSWDRSDYQTGIRQIFLGIGLAIFLGIVAGEVGFGIGALVFFIGLGKWYIARKSMNENDHRVDDDINKMNDNTSNF